MHLHKQQLQPHAAARQHQHQLSGASSGAELVAAQRLAGEAPAAIAPRSQASAQLLAFLPGGEQAVAAVGLRLLLLRAVPTAVQTICCLLDCTAPIAAVAVSNDDVPGSIPGTPQKQRWVAAIAGQDVHFVAVGSGTGGGAVSSPTSSTSVSAGAQAAWQSCAWHPHSPVCAVLAPGQLQLVQLSEVPSSASAQQAGMAASHTLLASVSGPTHGSLGSTSSTSSCCIAWLGAGPPCDGLDAADSSGGSCLVCWEPQRLELLQFGKGWRCVERRQMLLNLPGPVCGLAPAGAGSLLIATKRAVSDWLGAARSEQPVAAAAQQQQQEAERAGDILQRRLQAASLRSAPVALRLPRNELGNSSSPVLGRSDGAAEAPAAAAAFAATVTGLSSTDGVLRPAAASGPAAAGIPGFLMLPGEAAQPSVSLHGAQFGSIAVDGGSGSGGRGGGGGSSGAVQVQHVRPSEGHVTLLHVGHKTQATVQLGVAPDVVQAAGTLAVLSSSRGAPALAVCGVGPADCQAQQQQHATLRLQLPADMPEGCCAKVRGMAALGPPAGASVCRSPLLVWVLLAAAPKAAAAPFLSAALAGSGEARQQPAQLWLCCYRLAVGASLVEAAAIGGLEGQEEEDAIVHASQPAGSALGAVLAMQQAVQEMRRELSSRLNGLDEQLAGLMSQLQGP